MRLEIKARTVARVVTCVVGCVVSSRALAAEPDRPAEVRPSDERPSPPKNAFSLAFAVRPWAPPNLIRIDSAFLFDSKQMTSVPTLTVGGKLHADVGVYLRGAVVANAPDGQPQRSGFANPAFLGLWSPEIAPKTRLPIFLGVAIPVGEGGGDKPEADSRAAVGSGIYARQAMDNALFAPNYYAVAVGAGVSRVQSGLTLQVEATVFQLFRARGAAMDAESTRTNLTSGINAGYALTSFLNVNLEAHYQHWLSTPAPVAKDSALRQQLTAGGGVRFNIPVEGAVLRPGIGYFRGVDAPMASAGAHIVQVDFPIVL
jgi:hypothetical protein